MNTYITGIPDIYGIEKQGSMYIAYGSNLAAILAEQHIDIQRTYSDNLADTLATLGIEATRNLIVRQLHKMADIPNEGLNTSINLLADYMCHQGKLVPANRTGLDEYSAGVLRCLSFENIISQLQKSAAGVSDRLQDPSARIITGHLI